MPAKIFALLLIRLAGDAPPSARPLRWSRPSSNPEHIQGSMCCSRRSDRRQRVPRAELSNGDRAPVLGLMPGAEDVKSPAWPCPISTF